jgi:hypothetical protein
LREIDNVGLTILIVVAVAPPTVFVAVKLI